jgi:hypothetical protein
LAGNVNHKLVVIFDSIEDEDHARWFGQYLKTAYDNVAKVYVVVDESEDM